MYGAAEGIMVRALESQDLRTALTAIRTAVDVMGEARQYMELRGELSGELGKQAVPVAEARIVITSEPALMGPFTLPGPHRALLSLPAPDGQIR